MIVKRGHPLFGKVQLKDSRGTVLPWCFYFNTKTFLGKFFLGGTKQATGRASAAVSARSIFDKRSKTVTVSATIVGAKLFYNKGRSKGKEVKG